MECTPRCRGMSSGSRRTSTLTDDSGRVEHSDEDVGDSDEQTENSDNVVGFLQLLLPLPVGHFTIGSKIHHQTHGNDLVKYLLSF